MAPPGHDSDVVPLVPHELSDLTSGGGIPLMGEELQSWRITGVIGSGAMGTVYGAIHAMTGGQVAIKVLSSLYADDQTRINRFFSEARLIARISHGNVVVVHDVGTLSDGRPYYVMELIDGYSLAALVAGGQVAPIDWTVSIMIGVLRGLAAAHQQGILHRDVKPANILINADGTPKLSDFGVAKLLPEMNDMQISLTTDGTLLGTPAYLSPEQALGVADARSDLYSLGVAMFEVLCGSLPFRGPTLFETLRMHQECAPPRPSLLRHDLPPALEGVILRALAKSPADRFQSADEMGAALRGAMAAPNEVVHGTPAADLARTMLAPAPAPMLSPAPTPMPPAPVTPPGLGASLSTPVLALGALVVVFGVILGWMIMSRGTQSEKEKKEAPVAVQAPAPTPAPTPTRTPTPTPTPTPSAIPSTSTSTSTSPESLAASNTVGPTDAEPTETAAEATPAPRARKSSRPRRTAAKRVAPRAAPTPPTPVPTPQPKAEQPREPKEEKPSRVRYLDGNDL